MSRKSPARLQRLRKKMVSAGLKFEHLESRNLLAADAAFWMAFEAETSDRIGVNEGTPQGNIQYIEGRIGKAVKFGGSESINVLKQSGSLDFDSSDFTIETWIKADPIQNGVPTILLHNYGGLSAGVSYYGLGLLPSGGLYFDCRDTVGNYVVVGDDAPDAVNLLDVNWHHVVAKREGNTFSIHVDGALRKAVTQSLGSIHTTTAYVRISGSNTGPSNWISPTTNEPWTNYTGALDELTIYRRALSATEIVDAANPKSVNFAPPVSYGDSGAGYGLGHGDFNQDGIVDLATANYGTGSLNVFLGQGNGVYGSPVVYSVGGFPSSVAVGDIDGDGELDLATGTYSGHTLVVLFGNGDGTFGDMRSWSNGFDPVDVKIGDMNNDGRNDVVSANYWNPGGSVTVLLSGAGRTFQAPVDYTANSGTEALVLRDVDGDNDLDVATADFFAGTMSILLNNGSGALGAPMAYASGSLAAWIESADFNRDGHSDMAVSNYDGQSVSIFLSNGNGTFQSARQYATGTNASVLRSGDLNQDGIVDLAISLPAVDALGVLLGNGDGTFGGLTTFATGDGPVGITIADLDGNGTLDLANANYLSANITVLKNLALPPNTAIGPIEDANPIQNQVLENASLGTVVGVTALAVDPDNGDVVTYTLTNNAGGSLAIDPVTGIVSVAGAIDYEQSSTLTIEVRATSTDGSFNTAVFSIGVIDVVEGITFEGTAGNDTLKFWPAPTAGQFYFKRNAEPNLLFTPTSNVIVNGNGGVDTLIIEGTSGENQFDILADRITFNTVSFYANQVTTRQINALGSGDTVRYFGGPANVNGGSAVDKLIAMQPDDHTWTVTGVNAGNLDGQVFFTSVESLIGNAGVDVFNLGAAASLSSIVDGMGGGDLIDYSAVQASITTNLQSGSSTRTGGIRNIEQIVGSAAVDTLILNNTGNTVEVTGASVGSLSSGLAFAAYENITGGSGIDSFTIGSQGQILGNLNGGGGNDSLQFLTNDNLQINLAASTASRVGGSVVSIQQFILGTGTDTVLGRNAASTWVVGGANSVTTSGVSVTNVENLIGGADLDTLTGPIVGSNWELTGADAGALGGLAWNGFENVTGGSGDDTFMFRTGAALSGTLNGGSGADTLDFSAFGQDVTLDLANLSAVASSSTVIGRFLSLTTVKGTEGLDTIIGANNNNTWRVTSEGGNVDGLVFQSFEKWQGGTAADTLIGLNTVNQWQVTSSNAGSVGNIQFSAVESLTGNSLNDTFAFVGSGSLSGTVNGGSGNDSLDFSSASSAVVVNLATNSTSQVGVFVGVEQIIGSLSVDTVIGANAASTWTISANNAVNVRGSDFTSFESLVGGAVEDTFRALEGIGFLGTVEGGAGSDRLDYGVFATSVNVNLSTGVATGFGQVLGIENVTGGLGNDTLIGDSQANVLNGGSGDDILLGMAGDDTINGSNGRDMIFGGTGSDLLHGNNGDDLLIGGSSVYINEGSGSFDQVALDALMLEWRRTDSTYSQRVARIRGTSSGGLNGNYYLSSLTIIDDLTIDDLWGDANTDWFWAGAGDTLHATAGEEVN